MDIKDIESPQLLNQLFEYLQVVKHTSKQIQPNRDKVMQFAGLLSDSEAMQITKSVNEAFNNIEGEW